MKSKISNENKDGQENGAFTMEYFPNEISTELNENRERN